MFHKWSLEIPRGPALLDLHRSWTLKQARLQQLHPQVFEVADELVKEQSNSLGVGVFQLNRLRTNNLA